MRVGVAPPSAFVSQHRGDPEEQPRSSRYRGTDADFAGRSTATCVDLATTTEFPALPARMNSAASPAPHRSR